MKDLNDFLWSLFFSTIDILGFSILLSAIIKNQKQNFIFNTSILMFLNVFVLILSRLTSLPMSWINIIVLPILIKLMFNKNYKVSLIIYFIVMDISYAIQVFIICIASLFYKMLIFNNMLIGTISQALFLGACILIYCFVNINPIFNFINKKNVILSTSFYIVNLCVMFIMILINLDEETFWQYVFYTSFMFFSLLTIFIVSFISQLKIDAKKAEVEMSKKRFEEMGEIVSVTMGKLHEMHNHIQAMVTLTHVEDNIIKVRMEMDKYFSCNFTEARQRRKIFPLLHRPTVESMVYYKLLQAEKLNLNFEINIDTEEINQEIEDYTLNEMLCCLLDNAFEASNANDTVILNIYKPENKLYIEVKNEHEKLKAGIINKMFTKSFSTKQKNDTGHIRGYGLYHLVKNLKEKNGRIEVFNEDRNGKNFVVFRLTF